MMEIGKFYIENHLSHSKPAKCFELFFKFKCT